MRLAILSPRLKLELQEVEKYLLSEYNGNIADYHKEWADMMKAEHSKFTIDNVTSIV